MSVGFILARLTLSAVFAAAGFAKLRDREGTRQALSQFGAPARLVAPLALALPGVELVVAGALVFDGSASWGALGALGLLLLFSSVMARSLARGRAPDCHCFGQLHSTPASGKTLARNAALGAIAGFVVMGDGTGFGTIEWGVVGLLVGLVSLLALPRPGALADPPEGFPVGSVAPDFRLSALDGDAVSLEGLRTLDRPVLLVFTDPGCGPCVALAPELARWQREHADELSTWVVASGDAEDNAAKRRDHGLQGVLLDPEGEVASAYRANGTPTAVVVRRDGRIGSGVAGGADQIAELVAGLVTNFEPLANEPEPVPLGEPRLARRELLRGFAVSWAALLLTKARPAWAAERDQLVPHRGRCPRSRRCGSGRCCPKTFVCRRKRLGGRYTRRCVCPRGKKRCGKRCVRLKTDPLNCGSCGKRCPAATVCVDGRCVGGDGTGNEPGGGSGSEPGRCTCAPGRTCCQGECTDLNTSEEHCGRCSSPCCLDPNRDPAQCPNCENVCEPGQRCCEGHCRNVRNDPNNCGACGNRCSSGQVCGDGTCRRRCPAGQQRCGQGCFPRDDSQHCGSCANSCSTGHRCCTGPSGHTLICTNTSFDRHNCGGCGIECGPRQVCRTGRCA